MADKIFPIEYQEITSLTNNDYTPVFREGEELYKIKTSSLIGPQGIQGIQGPAGNGNMNTSTYDTNNSGIVDDAEKLGGQLPSYYAQASALSNTVQTLGNQTIAGIKTFSDSPIVPTPTTSTQATNKNYVDTTLTSNFNTLFESKCISKASDNVHGISSTVTFTNSTYQDKISITTNTTGYIRLKTTVGAFMTSYNVSTIYFTLYRNGSIVVTERSFASNINGEWSYTTFTDDLSCTTGDVFTIKVKVALGGGGNASVLSGIYFDKLLLTPDCTISLL